MEKTFFTQDDRVSVQFDVNSKKKTLNFKLNFEMNTKIHKRNIETYLIKKKNLQGLC